MSSSIFARLLLALLIAVLSRPVLAQPATADGEENFPAPGATGNADNVPFIGRSDPDGNPVRLSRRTGHVSNYDEQQVADYTLPDPLVTADGDAVTTPEDWWSRRRPEILSFYRTQIYGRVPINAPSVTWQVAETDENARDGTAIEKRLIGRMGDDPEGPAINVTLIQPQEAGEPTPVLLNVSFFSGARRGGRRGGGRRGGGRRGGGGFDLVEEVLDRGWSYAIVGYNDIQPDRADQWTEGVIGLTLAEGQTRPADDEWGTISAWAWGVSRIIDYFEKDSSLDAGKVAITGASRLGKTVLWASAQDDRVAAVFSAVPGEMGASLIRRDWGETLDDMAQNFAWQFAGNMQNWAGRWNELPVDQHMLIALSAPRPVYINGGLTDQWSDPKGEFLAMVGAGPVYELLGSGGLGTSDVPELDEPVVGGGLAFHYHSRGHTALPADWEAFLDFASQHFAEVDAGTPDLLREVE